jgi:hypothetical protein
MQGSLEGEKYVGQGEEVASPKHVAETSFSQEENVAKTLITAQDN